MKKLTYAILLAAISLSFLSGCNSGTDDATFLLPKPGEDVDCVGDFCDQPSEDPVDVYAGPTSVTATDGMYNDKVGINWETVTDAVSYRIYRSSSIIGPFTDQIASINADDLVNVDTDIPITDPGITPDIVTTPSSGSTCDNPVMQASYESKRDIGNGIYLPGLPHPLGEHYTIDLYIGGQYKGVITFDGAIPFGTWWTQEKIVAEFNKYLGSDATCYPVTVDGRKYIRIVSSKSIRMTNEYEYLRIAWVPLDFLDYSADWDTEINVQPVQIACNDTTPPTVEQVSPANNATDIALNAKVSVAFSEPINTATLTTSSFTLSMDGANVPGTVSNTGIFTPQSELVAGKEYIATITTAVTDLAGNPLASNYSWKFYTSASSEVLYYYIDDDVNMGEHYYYVITAVDADGKESEMSPVEEGFTKVNDNVPTKVPSCSASEGQIGGISVTWVAAEGATYYKVYRISSYNQVQVGGNITGTSYTDSEAGPGLFFYKVAPFNDFGEGGSSDPDAGFRAITDQEFFDLVYAEEESALNQIDKLSATGTGMLGTETVYDRDGNGTCVYNASYNLASGKATVVIQFNNYSDFFLTLNGTQTTVANTSATGTITGELTVSGIYNGSVGFNIILTEGVATGGTYTVKQTGGTETTLPGTYVP